jgi:hypothetical protein
LRKSSREANWRPLSFDEHADVEKFLPTGKGEKRREE